MRRVKAGRLGLLYSGAVANAVAAVLAHYPWVSCDEIERKRSMQCSFIDLTLLVG
jgi:hypothetical protein